MLSIVDRTIAVLKSLLCRAILLVMQLLCAGSSILHLTVKYLIFVFIKFLELLCNNSDCKYGIAVLKSLYRAILLVMQLLCAGSSILRVIVKYFIFDVIKFLELLCAGSPYWSFCSCMYIRKRLPTVLGRH